MKAGFAGYRMFVAAMACQISVIGVIDETFTVFSILEFCHVNY